LRFFSEKRKVIKKAKEISRLTYNNREFNKRDKDVIEKHASHQNFNYKLSLQDPEFVKANSLEICLKIGDILVDPKKDDPVTHSNFCFPDENPVTHSNFCFADEC
jgi:hypothetical protein